MRCWPGFSSDGKRRADQGAGGAHSCRLSIMLYPMWRDPRSSMPVRKFFAGIPLVILVGCIPVAATWLGPALHQTGLDFAYNLIWRQAEGRISGSLESAHARPFYFYLLLPAGGAAAVGVSFRSVAVAAVAAVSRDGDIGPQDSRVLIFLFSWLAVVVVIFSLISGKQPLLYGCRCCRS